MYRFGWSLIGVILLCAFIAQAQILSPILNGNSHVAPSIRAHALVNGTNNVDTSSQPLNNGVGDTLVLVCASGHSGHTFTASDNQGNSYSAAKFSEENTQLGTDMYMFVAFNTAAATGNYGICTISGTSTDNTAIFIDIQNAQISSDPTDALAKQNITTTAGSCTTGTFTTTTTNEIAILIQANNTGGALTSSYTVIDNLSNYLADLYAQFTTIQTGVTASVTTAGGSTGWLCELATFKGL